MAEEAADPPDNSDDAVYGFGEEETRRIAESVRGYERDGLPLARKRRRGPALNTQLSVLGKLSGTCTAGGSATMAIWDGTADTGQTITVYNWFSQDVPSGKKVMASFFDYTGNWYIIAADC